MKSSLHAIITGGSLGLGLELASALAGSGYGVTLVARDPERLRAAAARLRETYPGAVVESSATDVSDEAALQRTFAGIAEQGRSIDLLINCAGILIEGPFQKLTDADFRRIMDVNYFGALNAIRAALPHLKSGARILNVASMAALTGVFGYTAYCGSKHALLGASDALRAELVSRGITVQVACPGEFDSPMVEALDRYRTPENRAHVLTLPKTPMKVIVKDLLRGLETRRFLIVPGARTRAAALGLRLAPWLARMVGDQAVRAATTKV